MSRPSIRRALVAALATVASLPLAAGAASAAEVTVTDTRGDMWVTNPDITSDGPAYVKAPRSTYGDFLRTTFAHTDKRVAVRAAFVELERTGGKYYFAMRMRDQDGKRHVVSVEATRNNRAGKALLETPGGREIDCPVARKIDYARNTVTVSFPRACINNPRWLQFTAANMRFAGGKGYIDNPHDTKADPKAWTSRVRRG
ncbi:MAG: hypothetical protein ACRDPJ_02845 [Nocardioidaceae bacterium]